MVIKYRATIIEMNRDNTSKHRLPTRKKIQIESHSKTFACATHALNAVVPTLYIFSPILDTEMRMK